LARWSTGTGVFGSGLGHGRDLRWFAREPASRCQAHAAVCCGLCGFGSGAYGDSLRGFSCRRGSDTDDFRILPRAGGSGGAILPDVDWPKAFYGADAVGHGDSDHGRATGDEFRARVGSARRGPGCGVRVAGAAIHRLDCFGGSRPAAHAVSLRGLELLRKARPGILTVRRFKIQSAEDGILLTPIISVAI